MSYCRPNGYGTKFLPTNVVDHQNLGYKGLWVKRGSTVCISVHISILMSLNGIADVAKLRQHG
jgi:hypothetical protein